MSHMIQWLNNGSARLRMRVSPRKGVKQAKRCLWPLFLRKLGVEMAFNVRTTQRITCFGQKD
jgi:hypothetical protein